MRTSTQKGVSVALGAIGLVLLAMMITLEGEFGALPLALILIAVIGYITARKRERSPRPKGRTERER